MRIGEVWKRQATRWGLIAGLSALVLWPGFALMGEPLRLPFLVALLVTALAGASILCITAADMLTIRRSRHARPARLFDLALGALLAGPAALALSDLLGRAS